MLHENEIQYFKGLICQSIDRLSAKERPPLILNEFIEKHPDPLDQALASHDRDVAIMIQERKEEKLTSLKEALQRIREGTYGICEECAEMISKERLRVSLFATLCIDCKRKGEISRR
jgi:DnaK suppressor protein